jgi:hypothetical protein
MQKVRKKSQSISRTFTKYNHHLGMYWSL